MKLTTSDKEQLARKGISEETLDKQLAIFQTGIPFVNLQKPATIGNGIHKFSKEQEEELISLFESHRSSLNLLKFTPASGAATRMFKFLFQFLDDFNPEEQTVNAYINNKKAQDLRLFFVGLDSFPFYKEVRKKLVEVYGEEETDININRYRFVKMMLEKDGLDLGNQPKGLFPFHKYKRHNASAFEEHLFEGALYACNDGLSRLHFTISPQHKEKFEAAFKRAQSRIAKKTATRFDVTYSFQAESTDTVAVHPDNSIFRESGIDIHFRPGGHGALIKNLNEQDADIIFIKNIDNVVTYSFENEVARSKKILAGKLIGLQSRVFHFLKMMDESPKLSGEQIQDILQFLEDDFNLKLAVDFNKYAPENQVEYLREQLDRPIRVCGMVRNEGEPGGGPFWVKRESGRINLEIIESVQIDKKNKKQQEILQASTHFNPVDVVCGIKNYKSEKYDLLKFVDPKAGFISEKTVNGKPIKALEHPGLWNGAMAYWNTIFVEVPLITFNPVKTVNDLLKPAHQVK
ncbi:DUF4301 family protein [Dokdonia sinensis]|uniref:DUF4301 family protein n=1 Tax=Dokdonia sinensis TaxID=2479847 RepID=A0A3M0G531_9FLAO|nr:DUF4301 family protein [Dokdonia sinensis]RMB59167.1 DUF4301 family protein [Dokdonia sinensis]